MYLLLCVLLCWQLLAANVLNPRSIDVSLDDIGGLDHVKSEMRLKVLKPLSEPDTFCTTLWRPVKGVLFYGPPGTGESGDQDGQGDDDDSRRGAGQGRLQQKKCWWQQDSPAAVANSASNNSTRDRLCQQQWPVRYQYEQQCQCGDSDGSGS